MLSEYVRECLDHIIYVARTRRQDPRFVDGIIDGHTYKVLVTTEDEQIYTFSKVINGNELDEESFNEYVAQKLGLPDKRPQENVTISEGTKAPEE